MRKIVIWLLLGLNAGAAWAKPTATEAMLHGVEARRTRLKAACFENFQNQFTPGYKATICSFDDGDGKKALDIDMRQGQIIQTQAKTHLAVRGQGFLVLQGGLYTRDGRFLWQAGRFVDANGRELQGYRVDRIGNLDGELQSITVALDPSNQLYESLYQAYRISNQGVIFGDQYWTDPVTGQTSITSTPLYRLALADFPNPHRLTRVGLTAFKPNRESGPVYLALPGMASLGQIVPGSLESANVDFLEQGFVLGALKQGEIHFLNGAARLPRSR